MRKIYLSILFIVLVVCTSTYAQRSGSVLPINKKFDQPAKLNHAARTNAACDTINFPIPDTWNLTLYGIQNNGGFVTGSNRFGDKEKASYFDLSSTANKFLLKTFFYLGYANSNVEANLSKIVAIKVYGGDLNTGPILLLATVEKTLAQLKADVEAKQYTEIIFPTPVTLPDEKTFFVSMDISNLEWDNSSPGAPKDTLAIVSTTNGDDLADENGLFVEKVKTDNWSSGFGSWGLDLNLTIFPVVNSTPDCSTLPIVLSSFTGEKVAGKNSLKWITKTEFNSKMFDVERSADGVHFSSIGAVASKAANGNSIGTLQYLFDDRKPLAATNYYRLKQTDKDGKYAYSGVVVLKGSKANILQLSTMYPNPAKSNLNIIVSAAINEDVSVVIADLAGKTLLQQKFSVVAGDNNLSLNVDRLAAGGYVIRATGVVSKTIVTDKFMKN